MGIGRLIGFCPKDDVIDYSLIKHANAEIYKILIAILILNLSNGLFRFCQEMTWIPHKGL